MIKIVLPCGHMEAHMYRARHRGELYKYCMLCLFEKVGMHQIGKEPVEAPKTQTKKKDEKV